MLKTLIMKAAFIAFVGSVSFAAHAIADAQRFDLPAGDLIAALESFAKQADVDLVYQDEQVKGLRTSGVSGNFSPRDAIMKLLEGTPLQLRTDEASGALLITSPLPSGGPAPTSTTENQPKAAAHTDSAAMREKRSFWNRFRLAQAETDPSAQGVGSDSRTSEGSNSSQVSAEAQNGIVLDEIVVTGTHIRGVAPIGSAVQIINREEIQASGRGRIVDIMATLPQNFAGTAGEVSIRDLGAANRTRGQAIDLRGLGASSTLVLVNGRRQAHGGLDGSFVDISSLAASAVERIEILPEGASAIYGSDAIGGVVNFVLRKDFDGLELSARAASTGGGADEFRPSLLFGKHWQSGDVLLGIEHYQRDPLMAADTFYSSLNRDYRSIGGDDFRFGISNPGTIYDPNTGEPAYAIPTGQDGTDLTISDLTPGQNPQDSVTSVASIPEQEVNSAFFSVSQSLREGLELFADGRYAKREMTLTEGNYSTFLFVPPSNPFDVDPYDAGVVIVGYQYGDEFGALTQAGETETYSLTGGVLAKLARDWELQFAATYASENNHWDWKNITDPDREAAALADSNPATALNVFGDHTPNNPATLEAIRMVVFGSGKYSSSTATAIMNGPLFSLPAGPLKGAVGLDYRKENLTGESGFFTPFTGESTITAESIAHMDRRVSAAFGEVVVPVIGAKDAERQSSLLEFSLAGRYEDYSDFGSTFNPKFGLAYRPLSFLAFRGTLGTSFRAPRFNELSPSRNTPFSFGRIGAPDPQSSTGVSNIVLLGGGNPDLEPETADIWTAGFDISDELVDGLSLSATYVDLDYNDKIATGGQSINTLRFEREWAEIITRNPTAAQVSEVCSRSDFTGTCPPNVAAIIDTRIRNLAKLHVQAIDATVRYRSPLPLGELGLGLASTYTLKYERSLSSTSAGIDVLDTVSNPLALRARANVGWSVGDWTLNTFVNHAGAYERSITDNTRVGSWTTVDASLGFRPDWSGWASQFNVLVSLVNAFDREPPYVNQVVGFDSANASEMGRTVSIELSAQW